MPDATRAIGANTLKEIAIAVFRAGGSEEREAGMVAERLVEANLLGHDSHGVGMIPAYVKALTQGRLRPNQHISVARDKGPFLVIDGNVGYGQVIGQEAMELAIDRAKEMGIAVAALRDAHHIGRIGAWAEMCADEGFVSIHYVNAVVRVLVAPHGGGDARFGTNPYTTAIPATKNNPRMILDMATSKIAMGKVRVAHNIGGQAPPEALIGPNGMETTDPGVMYREPKGALLPFGLHKGYGLAVICETLAGAFTGGGTIKPALMDGVSIINNMLTVILDPEAIGPRDRFDAEVDSFVDWIKASPARKGGDGVMLPGDPERNTHADRKENGIHVDAETWEEILAAAEAVGLARADVAALAA